jgi:hypothetical protein
MKYKLIFSLDLDKIDNYYSCGHIHIHRFMIFKIYIYLQFYYRQWFLSISSHFFIGTGNYPFPTVCYDPAPVKETYA